MRGTCCKCGRLSSKGQYGREKVKTLLGKEIEKDVFTCDKCLKK